MRILSINNTADIYGASRCIERVYGRFVENGHEIHVVVPEHGPLVALLEARGIHVHIQRGLPIMDRSRLRSPIGCIRFMLLFPISVVRLAVLALRLHIDVIHSNVIVLPSPAVAAFITGKPHVWHIRELLGDFSKLWKSYQRYISSLSTRIVAISHCTRDQFDPAIRQKVEVIYDGLEDDEAKVDIGGQKAFRDSFSACEMLVGVVGRLKFHRKGQEILVRAAGLLKAQHPNVHYAIIGSAAPGNEEHELRLRELISATGLESNITLVGDTNDAISVLAALDIAVVPSIQPEPFGCVVIEAMIVGTPVVGSRCGGIAEQIVDGESGLLFPPGDPVALAAAIDRLLNDEQLRIRLAEGGIRRVRDNFPLEVTYQSLLAAFFRAIRTVHDSPPTT